MERGGRAHGAWLPAEAAHGNGAALLRPRRGPGEGSGAGLEGLEAVAVLRSGPGSSVSVSVCLGLCACAFGLETTTSFFTLEILHLHSEVLWSLSLFKDRKSVV